MARSHSIGASVAVLAAALALLLASPAGAYIYWVNLEFISNVGPVSSLAADDDYRP